MTGRHGRLRRTAKAEKKRGERGAAGNDSEKVGGRGAERAEG